MAGFMSCVRFTTIEAGRDEGLRVGFQLVDGGCGGVARAAHLVVVVVHQAQVDEHVHRSHDDDLNQVLVLYTGQILLQRQHRLVGGFVCAGEGLPILIHGKRNVV